VTSREEKRRIKLGFLRRRRTALSWFPRNVSAKKRKERKKEEERKYKTEEKYPYPKHYLFPP
jgi:hypothetical protein